MPSTRTDEHGVLVDCSVCGRTNRLRFEHLHQPERCGDCKSALNHPGQPIAITSAAVFDRMVAHASVPVVVDFWAPWCGPCRMVAPELEKVARAMRGRVLVAKVDTDELGEIGARFRIQSIPTMAVFADGREAGRVTGARPAADITAFIERTIGGAHGRA